MNGRKLTECVRERQASQEIYLHRIVGCSLNCFLEYLFVVDGKPQRTIWFLQDMDFGQRKILVGQDAWEKLHENKKDRAARTIKGFLGGNQK